ncbi:ribose-5-phosphate isomerase [Streptomyces violaceusniger]|uniref:D-erythrulose 4-phosphate isomerase n=1 Tax=Streptomyces violaceusniger (strain Tu 4113) TaxID=653045 RepID=G2PI22_STRV4|nr:ribose-5-phosphate isomerase [Streptomyces violaceusniger]AEM88973.1 ribose 5-phosphate isomerase [Streptomyces violaceusniger Tu 4113]
MERLRIALGSDRAGHDYKTLLAEDLQASDAVIKVIDVGVHGQDKIPYPKIAVTAAQLIASGCADRALLICHTGLGMAIAANKVPGIRAVTAHDPYSVRCSIVSNNAQVLTFGQGVVGLSVARRLAAKWLTYRFDPNSSAAVKVEAIHAFETSRNSS